MTTPQMVNMGDMPVTTDVTEIGGATMHPVGMIESGSAQLSSLPTGKGSYAQKVPKTGIDEHLCRPVQIAQWTLSSSDTVPSVVNASDPWTLFLANPSVAQKIANYGLIRGTIEVIFSVAIPGGCFGSYVISAFPTCTINVVTAAATSLPWQQCMGTDYYFKIDGAHSQNGVFQLPFVYPYDYAALPAGPAGMWIIALCPLAAMQTTVASGVSTGQVTVYARLMEDYELTVPTFQGRSKTVPTKTMKQFAPDVYAAHSGPVSSLLDRVADVGAAVGKLPLIGKYAETAGNLASHASNVASWFGYTRESNERPPTSMYLRSVSNVAHVDGEDSSELASLSINNSISIDPRIHGGNDGVDVASYEYLFKHWTIVKQMTWAPASASGTILGRFPVTPMYFYGDPSIAGAMPLTTAGFVGLPFQFWRGDMEYYVNIAASTFHRGTLQILWSPGHTAPPTEITNISFNQILECTTCDYCFKVGYARERPVLNNQLVWDALSTSLPKTSSYNGTLYFRVVNPLTSNNSAVNVTITVFARAAENMEFSVPRNRLELPGTTATTYSNDCVLPYDIRLQGKALGDDGIDEPECVELVPSSGSYPCDDILFGERIRSVRALLQKPCRIEYPVFQDSSHDIPIPFPAGGPSPWNGGSVIASPTAYGFTFGGYYRSLFTGVAGSERFKVFPQINSTTSTLIVGASRGRIPTGPPIAGAAMMDNMSPATYFAGAQGAEFTIPYYGEAKFLSGNSVNYINNDTWAIATILSVIDPTTNTYPTGNYSVYHSFGPDVRVGPFRFTPTLIYNLVSTSQYAF